MKYKLVAFDMDGTLTCEKSSWRFIHTHFGVIEQASKNTAKYGGLDTLSAWMMADYGLWNGATKNELKQIFLGVELRSGAKELINYLHHNGCHVVLITQGVDVLADIIAEKLNIKHVAVTQFVYDANGKAIDVDAVSLRDKGQILKEMANKLGVPMEKTAAVGDGSFDKDMFKVAGLAIGTNCKKSLEPHVDYVADDLLRIIPILS